MPKRLVQLLILALVVAVGAAAVVLARPAAPDTSGPFHGSPVPALYPDAAVRPLAAPLARARARGHRLAAAWLDAHPLADDAEFGTWAVTAIGPPPADDRAELAQLETLGARRTGAQAATATWLEAHGKKQPWHAFLKDDRPFLGRTREHGVKATMDAGFGLAKTLQTAAKERYRRPSPYVADPAVHAINQARYAGRTRYSYPSTHTIDAGVALAVMEPLGLHDAGRLEWMAQEIAYSRELAGGHYPSDLAAGMELGTMIGDYEARRAG